MKLPPLFQDEELKFCFTPLCPVFGHIIFIILITVLLPPSRLCSNSWKCSSYSKWLKRKGT